MRLVGGDGGRYERETIVEGVVIAPSERAVVDVLSDRRGEAGLEHRTPDRTYALGPIAERHACGARRRRARGRIHRVGSIEWEDTMEEVNRETTAADMRWMLVDRQTGKANAAIDWSFRVGDRVKIRLVNEMGSDHPMHHPFHIHGAGRFLVLSRDGAPEPNLVWKDTVLVKIPSGATARNRP